MVYTYGLAPWPGEVHLDGKRSLNLYFTTSANGAEPGSIVEVTGDYFTVACLDFCLRFYDIKPDGSRLLTVRDFLNGYSLNVGDILLSVQTDNR